jgi:diguanylate cyclase (GGDEF)-like protein/PAS domain S-box-containing protein
LITIARDLELRKSLESQLSETDQEFEDLVENADDAICTADLEGRLTGVNRATEKLSGYPRSEILGKPFASFVAPEFHETLHRMTRIKLEGRTSTVFEVEIINRDGQRIPVELNTRLNYRDDKPVGIQGIARDIRVRRQLADDLKQRNLELEVANTTIRSLMNQDPLTKLANRRSLEEEIERAMSFSKRSLRPIAIVICNLDSFKQINDNFGHAAGDEVLSAFGGLLGASCRLEDTAARYGGEEFVLLLPNTPLEAAMDFAERVHSQTETLRVPSGATVTASFGVTLMQPDDTGDSLTARADAALYRAKEDGRNRVAST